MSLKLALCAAVLQLALARTSAAKCQKPLEGKWKGSKMCVINKHGHSCSYAGKITITAVHDDGTMEAKYTWKSTEQGGNEGVEEDFKFAWADAEKLIGFYDESDDCSFTLVETEENGTYHGRLLEDKKKLDVKFSQPGIHPVAWHNVLEKK
jgi:hypothetical protein